MTPLQRHVVIASCCALFLGLSGCATCPSSRVIRAATAAETATGVEPLVHAHPLPPGTPFRLDEISRTESASLHIAQLRGAQTMHSHRMHDLVAVVRRGHGTLRVGRRAWPIGPGDVIELPRGTPHAVISRGPQPLIAIVIFTPPFDGQDVVNGE